MAKVITIKTAKKAIKLIEAMPTEQFLIYGEVLLQMLIVGTYKGGTEFNIIDMLL